MKDPRRGVLTDLRVPPGNHLEALRGDRQGQHSMLLEEFLKPPGISQNKLTMDIHVPATRIGEIVHGRRAVTPETALRLAHYFRTSPGLSAC